jgi:RND family efflux transporter MFP subunit
LARGARISLAALLGGAVAVAAIMLYRSAPAAGQPAAPAAAGAPAREAALTVTVTHVEPVELARTLTLNGTVHAWQEVIIAPEVGGYRVAVFVDVGDSVTAGQTLVELSTALLTAELATRRAALKQREAELINAEAALKRGASLAAMDSLAEADLDRLKSEALAAEARLDSAQADLETSQLRLQFARVTAPDDGVITSRTVTVGQIAQAGSEMLRLLRQGRVEWRGEVPEARLAELEAGQPVRIATADGTMLNGSIRTVAPTISSLNRTGLVYVDLESSGQVRPGMFARGTIEMGRGMGVTVPLQSLVSADGYSYVFVVGSDRVVERRRIETRAVQGSSIEVLSGLAVGERVVERGAGFLKDGDIVNVAALDQ